MKNNQDNKYTMIIGITDNSNYNNNNNKSNHKEEIHKLKKIQGINLMEERSLLK